jgi:hypothetical protein
VPYKNILLFTALTFSTIIYSKTHPVPEILKTELDHIEQFYLTGNNDEDNIVQLRKAEAKRAELLSEYKNTGDISIPIYKNLTDDDVSELLARSSARIALSTALIPINPSDPTFYTYDEKVVLASYLRPSTQDGRKATYIEYIYHLDNPAYALIIHPPANSQTAPELEVYLRYRNSWVRQGKAAITPDKRYQDCAACNADLDNLTIKKQRNIEAEQQEKIHQIDKIVKNIDNLENKTFYIKENIPELTANNITQNIVFMQNNLNGKLE